MQATSIIPGRSLVTSDKAAAYIILRNIRSQISSATEVSTINVCDILGVLFDQNKKLFVSLFSKHPEHYFLMLKKQKRLVEKFPLTFEAEVKQNLDEISKKISELQLKQKLIGIVCHHLSTLP